jgi:hypothetical protein
MTRLAVASTVLAAVGLMGCGSKPASKKSKKPAVVVRVADADLEVVLKPAKLVSGTALNAFVAELKNAKLPIPIDLGEKTPEQMAAEAIGIEMKDLVRVTISANTAAEKVLATLVASKDVDPKKIMDAMSASTGETFGKRDAHSGVDLLAPENEKEVMIAFVSKRVALLGNVEELKKGIDAYKAKNLPKAKPELAAVLKNASADACITVAMKASPQVTAAAPMAGIPPEVASDIDSLLVTIAAKDKFDIKVKLTTKTDASGEKIRSEATNGLNGAKAQFAPMFASPAMKPVMDTINGVTIGGTGKVIDASASIGPDIVAPLSQMAGMFMGMMGGGMGGGMPPGM